jgi:hypothetical protein
MREGVNIREFFLGQPQLFADPKALKGALRSNAEYDKVTLLVRQTARYPIAARSDGSAFRNSLLAVMDSELLPWSVLLCLLNSALWRWHHYFRFRDGRQPILPQLKVTHLRSQPTPLVLEVTALTTLEKLGTAISRRNDGIRDQERVALDEGVARLYALEPAQAAMVTAWHRERPR